MKNAILGSNDNALPRERFIPKEYNQFFEKPFEIKPQR